MTTLEALPPPKVYCQETNFKFFLLRRCLLLATIHGFSNSHSKSALGSLQKDSPVYRQKHANHSTFKKHRKQHIQYSNSSKICYSIKKKLPPQSNKQEFKPYRNPCIHSLVSRPSI